MTNEEVIQKLNEMKDTLMERGWTKVDLEDRYGRVCLLGARNVVTGRNNNIVAETFEAGTEFSVPADKDPYGRDEISDLLSSMVTGIHLYMGVGTPVAPVYAWNDQIAESINDVLNFLDQAIIKTKEEM